MSRNSSAGEVPAWALPLGIVIAVIAVALIGWKSFGSHDAPPGKDVPVHAGMYDFRKAAANGELGKHTAPSGAAQ
jgi:hypothetical protein